MGIKRREFLSFALGFLPALANFRREACFLSCRSDYKLKHYLSVLGLNGNFIKNIELPARGHGLSSNDTKAIVFARRPGNFAYVLDLATFKVIHKITSPKARHFYGHGVFVNDMLYSSENDFKNGIGIIGVYDASFNRLGEFESHGIGPHEIKAFRNNKTLVVANGGIKTHPDQPRVKLNLDSMRPNLSFLDITTGKLQDLAEPPDKWHQLSIRHIDVAQDDTIVAVMQFKGDKTMSPPLVGLKAKNQNFKLLSAPKPVQKAMKNYCASVSFARADETFAVSAPRGNLITYWSITKGYLGFSKQDDVSGLATDSAGRFFASSGTGKLTKIYKDFKVENLIASGNYKFDNHLYLV